MEFAAYCARILTGVTNIEMQMSSPAARVGGGGGGGGGGANGAVTPGSRVQGVAKYLF